MNSTENIGYVKSLDLLRGSAAISVTLFHFVIRSDFSYESLFRDIFKYGHLGVQVFFVISGFVIPYSMYKGEYKMSKIGTFFKKRLTRLEPPYIASIILVLLVNFIFFNSPYWSERQIKISLSELLLHLGYLNNLLNEKSLNQVYWSLGIEFQYYILIAFLFFFISGKIQIWSLVFILLNVLSLLFPYGSYIFHHLPFFIIGILVFRYLTKKDGLYTFVLFFLATIGTIYFKYENGFQYVIAAVIPLFFFFLLKGSSNFGGFIGNISYSLYLIHIPIGLHIINIGADFTNGIFSETLLIILTLLFTILFSYIFYKLIELPSREYAKRFKY